MVALKDGGLSAATLLGGVKWGRDPSKPPSLSATVCFEECGDLMPSLPSNERLKEALDYDPATGAFTWKIHASARMQRGSKAGKTHPSGHIGIKLDYVCYMAHRLAWQWMTGDKPPEIIDHINRNPSDNRWKNLRSVTRSENLRNSDHWPRKPRKNKKS